MNKENKNKTLPEKVVRRHAEMVNELLPEFSRLVIEEGRPADALLQSYLKAHREHGSRDRRFLAQAVFSFFRWYGWTVNKLKLSTEAACLIGAALDTTELPCSFRFMETRCKLPFRVEAWGSKTVAEKQDILNGLFAENEDVEPLELADLVIADFNSVVDPKQVDACIASLQQRPPAWIRTRSNTDELQNVLKEQDVIATPHEKQPAALAVDAGVSLTHILSKHAAQFVVQDAASQAVALIADPQPGGDWWDCCAGAGGKSMHLMDLMEQNGKVLSTDVRIAALKELKKRARKYGIKNVRTQLFNAVNDEPFTKVFDGVLVDAPCSGWGTWSRNPDARWRASRRDVIQCSTRQLKIMNNVKWCVKPGGVLIYAVCAFTQPETEEVVMKFLDQHENFKLEPFTNPMTGEQTDGQLQIWPWETPSDGMFIARFRRDA